MPVVIDKIEATAAQHAAPVPGKTRTVRIPDKLDTKGIVETLSRIGLTVPSAVMTAAATTGNLRASGHRFPTKEVDLALQLSNVGISDRIRFKTAMGNNGIIDR
jgi:hypothetical protein